jgi:mannobiose 2-epimerase
VATERDAVLETPWPLDGGPFAPLEAQRLAHDLEHDLRRHVVEAWFPRCVDPAGGFRSGFDRRWRPIGPQHRMLEFQARQTRLAAGLALAYPHEGRWADAALHGLRTLEERQWDREHGGWFWLTEASGAPLHGGTKHAHGTAYAVGACAAVHRATGDDAALGLAGEAFRWLERAHADDEHGGYHGWVTRDGRAIGVAAEVPAGLADPIDGPPDHKDVNVHSDLLAAFAGLYAVWPDRDLRRRLGELCELVLGRFLSPGGAMHYSFTRAWAPVPQLERFGYMLQTAWRPVAARLALGEPAADAQGALLSMVGHALARGWDGTRGGFRFAGPAVQPDRLEGRALEVPRRVWWVQAEGLRALLHAALLDPAEPLFAARFRQLLAFVRRHLLDGGYGGWFAAPAHDVGRLPLLPRLRGSAHKGHVWKDGSHEGEMYLACIRMLRQLPEHAPLRARAPAGPPG